MHYLVTGVKEDNFTSTHLELKICNAQNDDAARREAAKLTEDYDLSFVRLWKTEEVPL